jgi:hypothetical protein|tara:strand:+ start:968 stop:1087 length:120 start_codon:yes stop_codon:yes gene_type:complete
MVLILEEEGFVNNVLHSENLDADVLLAGIAYWDIFNTLG